MKILVFDNYDSFTYNLVQYLKNCTTCEIDICKNDLAHISEIDKYDKILLSPGPGVPAEAGILNQVIRQYASTKSILGICLGMQAIGEVYGGSLINLPTVAHGISTNIIHQQNDAVLYKGIPQVFKAGRYHSWIIDKTDFPQELEISSVDEAGNIMSLFHKKYDVRGVQFHPESILTPVGQQIIANWIYS